MMRSAKGASLFWRAALLLAVAAAASRTAAAYAGGAAWEWSPYRVQIDWHVAAKPQFELQFMQSLRDDVDVRLREKLGAAWQSAADGVDKRIEVRLDYEACGYVVEVREWDALSDGYGPAAVRRTADRRATSELVAAAIVEAFRPLLLVDEARDTSARGRQRAAGLYPPSMLDTLTRRGAAYVPFVRRFDRDGFAIETKPIAWTLLVVDEPRGAEAVCLVRSGLSNPFSLRRRGRTECLALAVGRPAGATIVRVATRDGRPLFGCRVFVQDGDAAGVLLGETNAAGRIVVPPGNGGLRMLVVTSRFKPLAKLPLIPGLVDEIDVPTVAEPELLAAEDRLVAWQAKFLDWFVERRVLTALASTHLEQDDRAAAAADLARLDREPKSGELAAELESLRRRYAGGSTSSGRMIAALFDEAAAAMKSLDDGAELSDLRKRLAAKKP